MNKYFRINKVALALLITLTSCIQSDNTESSLVIYSGRQESLVSEIFTEFTNETGIKVEVRYAKSNELAGTIILEGENSPADIFYSQDPVSLSLVASEGLFDNISESTLEKVPSWAVDSNGLWVGVSGRSRSLVVKSSYQLDNEVPNSLYDLNQEKYRGRLGLAPTNSSFITMISCLIYLDGEEKTFEWLKGINNLEYSEYPKNSPQVAAVDAGELEIGLVNHYYTLRFNAENSSNNIENLYMAEGCGALVMPSGIGVLSTSKNKDAALKLIDFLHSEYAQKAFLNNTYEFPLAKNFDDNSELPSLDSLNSPKNINWEKLSKFQSKAIELIAKAGF